jgi:hypothetical protein
VANIKLKLAERNGTTRTSLTSISWAWFDSIDPNSFVAPTDKGNTETTDANGFLEITLSSSTLTPGQAGTLVIMSSDTLDTGVYTLEVF